LKTLAGIKKIDRLTEFSIPRKIDPDEAYHLKKDHGLSYQEIANQFKCSKQAVHQAISRLIIPKDELESFKKNRADIFASQQARVLKLVDDNMIKNARLGDINNLFGTLYDKERLERGQSTNNTSLFFHVVSEAPDLPGDSYPQQDVVILPSHNTASDVSGSND
jgi:predicted DNA-binding protein YlxM (UPF0122 family)